VWPARSTRGEVAVVIVPTVAKHDLTLLTSRARLVTEDLKGAGMDPRDFRWERVPSRHWDDAEISRLVHNASEYFMEFDRAKNGTWPSHFRPGRNLWLEDVVFASPEDQMVFVPEWIAVVQRELEAGDPFAEFIEGDIWGEWTELDDTAFTASDITEFTARLEAIRQLLLDRTDDEETRRQTNAKVDQVIEALKHASRRDWMLMAAGLLFDRALALALSDAQVYQLIDMLVRGVRQLTGS
jgi:hypothetical protein